LIEPVALPGGAKLLLERVVGTESASIGFWFPFGSRHEKRLERGATHFCEHMMFKGTSARSALDIAREIDRVGGYLNAFTERECVCFHCVVPASSAISSIRVLCDMIARSSFSESDFAKEKGVIISEIASAEDDPEEAAFDAYLDAVWEDHPLARKITGEAAETAFLTRDSLYSFYSEKMVREGLIVSVAGAVDAEEVRRVLEEEFSSGFDRVGNRPWTDFPGGRPDFKPSISHKKADSRQVILHCGVPIDYDPSLDEFNALSVFNCAFGDSMSSRLFQNIREEKGYCYSIYSFFSLAADAGLWTVSGSSTKDSFSDFVGSVLKEIDGIRSRPLSDGEIDNAILHLAGSAIMASEDMEHRMKRLARQYLADGKAYSASEGIQALREVGRDRVREIGDRITGSGAMALLAYGSSFKDGDRKWKNRA
jgi:predicted Zn-dependent peptidase